MDRRITEPGDPDPVFLIVVSRYFLLTPDSRLLWAGAQADAERIQIGSRAADPDGDGWIGVYHPRIS